MRLTDNERLALSVRENGQLSPEENALIDDCFALIYSDGKAVGLTPAADDRAAALEAAFIRFLLDSRPPLTMAPPSGFFAEDMAAINAMASEVMREDAAAARSSLPRPAGCTCGPVRHWECNTGCKALAGANAGPWPFPESFHFPAMPKP
jgi:hypothetical protein